MSQDTKIECPSCSPEEKVPHEIIKLGKSPLVHCLECGLVYIAPNLETPENVSVRVYVNRIERPFSRWVKIDAGEVLSLDEEIVLNAGKAGTDNPYIITSLQVGVRRVPSARAEELDTIWARPLNEIAFAKRRKARQKHPMDPASPKPFIGVSSQEKEIKLAQES